jgi:hypothetical protein
VTQRWILITTCAALLVLGWVAYRVEGYRPPSAKEIADAVLADRVDLKIENHWRSEVQTITTPVTGQSGQVHNVSTTRNADESIASWKARHQEAIDMARSM